MILRSLHIAALAFAAALALTHAPAHAHAVLLTSDPPADAVLDDAPMRVTLTFNEPVEPVFVRVFDRATGGLHATLEPTTDGAGRVEADLSDLDRGRWLVSWRVVSGDSHPIGGSFAFSIGAAGAASSDEPAAQSIDAIELFAGAARAAFLAALLAAAGGALAIALLAPALPKPARAASVHSLGSVAIAAALTGIVFVSAQGALVAGGFDGATRLAEGLATPLGRTALAASGIAVLIALLLRYARATAATRVALAALGIAGLATLAGAGHAIAAPPQALATPAMALHVLAAGFWLGGLAVLLATARVAAPADLVGALVAFSKRAMPAVATLVVAGGIVAALQSRDPAALVATAWGAIFLGKLALVAGALALAAHNKWRLTGAIARGEPGATGRLVRNVRLEIVLIAGVLVATAALGRVPPPRALAETALPAPIVLVAHDHRHREATLTITTRPGAGAMVEVTLADLDGRRLALEDATLAVSQPQAGIEPLTRPMRIEDGVARLETDDLAASGAWRLDATLLVDAFDASRVRFAFERP